MPPPMISRMRFVRAVSACSAAGPSACAVALLPRRAVCGARVSGVPPGSIRSSRLAAWRRMVRASSSIERPLRAARSRSRRFNPSSSWRMVMLAIARALAPS